MKLVFYMKSGLPHHKNWDGIQRMCKSCDIDFEYTNSLDRIKENNYDILYCMCNYVDPYIIPNNIKIIYGPQLWVIPEPPIVGKYNKELEERCVFNTLSNWVRDYCLELASELIIPTTQFPIAVDTNKFNSTHRININNTFEYDCIVYIKRRSTNLINYTINLLNERSLKYIIFTYGHYSESDYLNTLNKSKFMISLDAHESQGFALQEAMSSGVPLLVVNATSMYDEKPDGYNSIYEYLKPNKLIATSVPYWADECGIKIEDESKLPEALDIMLNNYNTFTPCNYIMNTLSDKICMQRILDYFKL